MGATRTVFHTATIEHRVPGPRVEVSAVAYNLQYTKALVDDLVKRNRPSSDDVHTVRVRDHELVRINLYGQHPNEPARRLCVIGIGDQHERAQEAAEGAWFDYHASVLFTAKLGEDQAQRIAIRHRLPGVPAQRAAAVGVAYDLEYMRALVEAAVARNLPTSDELQVLHAGELTLMRVNLRGRHPLETGRRVCVGGIADRHYRALAAAEQAWTTYHTSLLFGAQVLGSS